jgi:hypothetical protein
MVHGRISVWMEKLNEQTKTVGEVALLLALRIPRFENVKSRPPVPRFWRPSQPTISHRLETPHRSSKPWSSVYQAVRDMAMLPRLTMKARRLE